MNDMVIRALEIAAVAHAGQVDKAGIAYIRHPITVASLVETPEEKMVAYLHDVVEDTDVTLADLKEAGFSTAVLDAVNAMTHRKDEPREEYLKRVKANPLARRVKLADLTHNSDLSRIPDPKEKDIKRREKYLKELEYLTIKD